VFNLEEFMNSKFLWPRENRCKWFNNLGVMRRWVYIERGGKCKNSAKNNIVNRFTKCVNWFRQQKYKPGWRMMWFKSLWIDSMQDRKNSWHESAKNESIQGWCKSNFVEPFLLNSEASDDTIHIFLNRFN